MQWELRLEQTKYLFHCGEISYVLIDFPNILENKSHVPLIQGNEHRLSLLEIAKNLEGLHGTLFRKQLSMVPECMLIDFLIARRLMKSAMPLHIVEIGATQGILSFHLASMIGQYNVESSLCCVCSVDDNQWLKKVSKVNKLPKLSRIVADYEQINLQSHKYDVVVLNGNEHFTDTDKIVREARRLVNSKGIIICLEKEQPLLSKVFKEGFPENETFAVNPNTTVFYAESKNLLEEDSYVPTEVKEVEDYLAEIHKALQEGTGKGQLRIYYKELEKRIDEIMLTSSFELKAKLIDCQDKVLNAMYPVELEDGMRKQKIILSIGLLASRGKEAIQKCLESLTPIREQICCELIIIDTGCDADVKKMLAGYADILKDFIWCDDFSKARNECLKYASGEWFLYLDDDELLVGSDELIAFFRSGEYCEYGCASCIQRNFLDTEASQYTDTRVTRMVKRDDDTHFEGKIYEYFAPVRGKGKQLHSKIYHYHFGYAHPDEIAKQKHFEGNHAQAELLELAEQVKKKLPILIANGMIKEAIAVVKQVQTMIPEDEELKKLADELNEI